MPIKDGLEMSKEIRSIDQDIPIIVVSALNEIQYFSNMITIGIDGFILKPLEFATFIPAVLKSIDKLDLMYENLEYKNSLEDRVKKIEDELKNRYYKDEITLLPNRFALLDDLKRVGTHRLVLIDINKFSAINDVYGTYIGDEVLRVVANRLREIVPSFCRVYRVSSDQFVFLPIDNKNIEKGMCRKLVKSLMDELDFTHKFYIENSKDTVDINISVTISVVIDVNTDKVLELADITLQYAKDTNQPYLFYREGLEDNVNHKKNLNAIQMVKDAIDDDRLVPYFQPIFKPDNIYYESLVRLIQKDGKVLSPFFFLDEIKNTPYYIKLTQIMIEKSFLYFKDRDISFSINISFEDISNQEIVDFLKQKLKEYNLAKYLILEILESESIKNIKLVKEFISSMKLLGVRIAIDDFGSGYSNFSYLLELEPNYIKIDGSIIKTIDTNIRSYAIAKAIVNFSKELGIETIAEFVHNKEVCNKVISLNIEGKQGYYLGEPSPNIIDKNREKEI
jgi:diguanylate cyclase (GGDEF)-like protein